MEHDHKTHRNGGPPAVTGSTGQQAMRSRELEDKPAIPVASSEPTQASRTQASHSPPRSGSHTPARIAQVAPGTLRIEHRASGEPACTTARAEARRRTAERAAGQAPLRGGPGMRAARRDGRLRIRASGERTRTRAEARSRTARVRAVGRPPVRGNGAGKPQRGRGQAVR